MLEAISFRVLIIHLASLAIFFVTATPGSAIDNSYVGVWSASPQCEDNMSIKITRKVYTGTEFYCRLLKSTREDGGWRAKFSCASEVEDYSLSIHWTILKNGRLRQSVDGLRTVELGRCS